MAKYNTNLASEFHVLSILHRLGLDAYLTLGNKKSVDIVAIGSNRRPIDVEVKGVAGKDDWTVGKLDPKKKDAFLILVSFEGNIASPDASPTCWIIPYKIGAGLVKEYKTKNGVRRNIPRTSMKDEWKNNWDLIRRTGTA